MNTRQKGSTGEHDAVEFLISEGYTIISRNYQTRRGEIDCIARDPDGVLVFVEVKSARGSSCGHPLSWVTPSKQKTIARLARRFLAEHKITGTPCRFDVIAIYKGKIDHLRNAFIL